MMVDGVILLVDASEGPLPQTRFVLRKALEHGLRVIVVINKIDRSDARAEEVLDEIYDLFIDLDANDGQIDFPVLYANGRAGITQLALEDSGTDLTPLMDCIVKHLPAPSHDPNEPFQMLVTDLNYSDYLGRLAIGRIAHGMLKRNEPLVCLGESGVPKALRASKLQVYEGTGMVEQEEVAPGDILVLAGIEDVHIGDAERLVDGSGDRGLVGEVHGHVFEILVALTRGGTKSLGRWRALEGDHVGTGPEERHGDRLADAA